VKPVRLYIKQHRETRKKYFGRTVNDPYKYLGSGKHWRNHLKTHGRDVETVWVSEPFEDPDELRKVAVEMSEEMNIVESEDWLNMVREDGVCVSNGQQFDGHRTGRKTPFTDQHKEALKKPKSEEHRKKLSQAAKGRKHSEETKRKIRETTKRKWRNQHASNTTAD